MLSFNEAVVRFFDALNLKPKFRKGHLTSLRNWHPHVGERYLHEIDRSTLQTFVQSRKAEGVKGATIRRDLDRLGLKFRRQNEVAS